jgi:serine/threonine-protein kinase
VARFAREARAAVKITGEHVARVSDVGTLENGAPYMVMEFLEGGDLAAWLHQRGRFAVDQAVEFVLQACVAVAEAHALGIVHRDLKPANLFCVRRADGKPSIKVLDFGISKVTDLSSSDGGMSVTKTSAMMGSPLYMSPEQMQSPKDVDAQTDVWAMGVILYELLAARVPFDGETIPEVAIKVATQAPPSLKAIRPDVPEGLEAAINKALEKSKAARYRNVAELALALGDFAPMRSRGLVERICGILQVAGPASMHPDPMPQMAAPPTPVAAGTMAALGRTTAGGNGGHKRVAALAVLATVGALGVVAVAGALWQKRGASDIVASPAVMAPPVASIPATTPAAVAAAEPPADKLVALTPDPPVPARPTPSASTPSVPAKGPAGRHAAAPPAAAAPPPPAAAAPAPPPAAAAKPPPPAAHKNQLDLGSFQ